MPQFRLTRSVAIEGATTSIVRPSPQWFSIASCHAAIAWRMRSSKPTIAVGSSTFDSPTAHGMPRTRPATRSGARAANIAADG